MLHIFVFVFVFVMLFIILFLFIKIFFYTNKGKKVINMYKLLAPVISLRSFEQVINLLLPLQQHIRFLQHPLPPNVCITFRSYFHVLFNKHGHYGAYLVHLITP